MPGFVDWVTGEDNREWKRNVESEMRRMREQNEKNIQNHAKAIKTGQDELKEVRESHAKAIKNGQDELKQVRESHAKELNKIRHDLTSAKDKHQIEIEGIRDKMRNAETKHWTDMKQKQDETELKHRAEIKQNQIEMKQAQLKHQAEMKQKQEEMNQAERRQLTEMKKKQEEMNQAERRQQAEMKKKQTEMEQAERRHQEELEKMNRGLALEGKIYRKRVKLLKKMPGESDDFPKGLRVPGRLFISLFGETGTGKTSLINSLKYTIDGRLKSHHRIQAAADNYQGAHTLESLEVVMTKYLSVIDNRGINSEKASNTTQQEDIIKQMEGKYNKGTVTWQSLLPAHQNEQDKRSYCSVMVFSAHSANVARQYRSFIHRLRQWQGRFPLAIITHVDKTSPKDVQLALQSGGIGDIYEVANITSGENGRDTLSPEHQLQLQELLEKCFEHGDSIFLRRQEIESG